MLSNRLSFLIHFISIDPGSSAALFASNMEPIKDFAKLLKPHPDNSQILLRTGPDEKALERIQKILEPIGIYVVRCDGIGEENPEWLLLQLSSRDMREAALKLSEAGFESVRGLNAKRSLKATSDRDRPLKEKIQN